MRGRSSRWLRAGLLAVVLAVAPAQGALELALPFTDHAVLQAGKRLPVWGVATPGATVRVELGSRTASTTAAANGIWSVEFAPADVSREPLGLVVSSGDERVMREDLVFGEVWLASGQSNMRWMLKDCEGGKDAIAAADDPRLRLFNFAGRLHPGGAKFPREFLMKLSPAKYYETEGWQRSSPASAPGFSGVAYYFGRKLRDELEVPVGILHLGVGGTPMEAHLPRAGFLRDEALRPLLTEWWKNPEYPKWCRERAALNLTEWLADPPPGRSPPHPFAPGFLWEAGIDPLLPFPVRGVIWYQGESNATVDGGRGAPVAKEINRRKFEALIGSWRRAWRDEALPVYFVQLPGLNRNWPLFREMQLEVSREVPHTGMAVSIDVGHPTNVHPTRKKSVGERLATLALAGSYGRKVSAGGPGLVGRTVEGDRILLKFDREVRPAKGEALTGFEIAGADRVFHPATAVPAGKSVTASSPAVKGPVAARYAWANDPKCNLVDATGSPASPFRTDAWPVRE